MEEARKLRVLGVRHLRGGKMGKGEEEEAMVAEEGLAMVSIKRWVEVYVV